MQRNVVILDIDYVTFEDKPVIRLFSKDGDKNVILIDDTFEAYLYVVADDLDACLEEIQDNIDVVRIEKVIKKDFQIEKEFLKVTFKHPQELAKSRDALRDLENVIDIRRKRVPSDSLKIFYDDDIKLPLILIATSDFLYGNIVCIFMFIMRSRFNYFYYLKSIIFPELIYTILVTLILYQLILQINKKLESEEQRSASKFV